jgi:hypothetical protein
MTMEASFSPNYSEICTQVTDPTWGNSPQVAGDYDCQSNEWGAISVQAKNGKMIGVKPVEFEVLEWRSNGPK